MSRECSECATVGPLIHPPPTPPARLFILSAVRLYREGLLWSLSRRPAFEMLGAADLSKAAVTRVPRLQPDVIILDVGVPQSFDTAKLLRYSLPAVKIIAFAVTEIDDVILACAEAGIAGYVAPDGSEDDLIVAVDYALRGELYCSPRIAGLLSRHVLALSAQTAAPADRPSLTRREQQILSLVSEGMSNKEIGRALQIGDSTVKNHVHNILEKLKVHRRGEAAARLRGTQIGSWARIPSHRRPNASPSFSAVPADQIDWPRGHGTPR